MEVGRALQIGGAQYPTQPIVQVAHQPVFGREDVDPVALAEQGRRAIGLGRVVAFGQYVADVAGGGDEAQAVPLFFDPQIGQQIVGIIGLSDGGGALQSADRPAGILGVVAVDMLVDAVQVDDPAVTGGEAQRGAAAIGTHPVDVVLAAIDVVDIAAVLHAIAHDAQRQLLRDDGDVERGGQVAARIAMLGGGQAGRHLPAIFGKVGGVGHQADDTAQRPGAVQRALRPFQHLDPADVVEFEVGVGRGIVQPHVAQILAGGRLGRPGDTRIRDGADEQLVAAGAGMGGAEARHPRQQGSGPARCLARGEQAAVQRFDHPGVAGKRRVALGSGNDDFGGRLIGQRGGLDRRGGGRWRGRGFGANDAPAIGADALCLGAAAFEQYAQRRFCAHPALNSGGAQAGERLVRHADAGTGLTAERYRRVPEPAGGDADILSVRP